MFPVTLSSFCESDTQFAERVKAIYREAFDRDPLLAPHTPVALEIVEKLGQGGMGAVFRVKDHRLGRFAALKILSEPNERNTLRFLNESTIASRLEHPCIPPIYEAGRTPDGQHFILMKLIEGRTLSKEIADYHKQGRPPEKLEELLSVLVKVGEAIAYANEHAIIHRDLKPSNIMVGRFGEVMVMDWGIAKDLEASRIPGESMDFGYTTNGDDTACLPIEPEPEPEPEVGSGQMLGTPGYLAPEQARGDLLDARCDVFNLGILLTLVLTGELPTPGDSENSMLAAAIAGITRSPLEIDPSVPPELDSLAKAALVTRVQHRLSSAKSFVKHLKTYLSGKEVEVHEYSKLERVLRATKRRPTALIALTLGAILVALTALYIGEVNRAARAEEHAASLKLKNEYQLQSEVLAHQEADRAKEALASFNEARVELSKNRSAKLIRGNVYKGIQASNRSQASLVTAAKIYKDARLFEEMKCILKEITRRFPPAHEALYQLHGMELREGYLENRLPKTSPFLEKLCQLAEDKKEENEYTLFAKGIELHRQMRLRAALKFYDQAEERNQGMAPLFVFRALAYAQRRDQEKSLADLTRALRISPHDSAIHSVRASIQMRLKNYQDALAASKSAITFNPKNPKLYVKRGRIHEALSMPEKALVDYSKAIELKADFFRAIYQRAQLYTKLNQRDKAIRDYQILLKTFPGSSYSENIRREIDQLKKTP